MAESNTEMEETRIVQEEETSAIPGYQDEARQDRRMVLFQKMMKNSLDRIIMSTERLSQFKRSFKEISAQNPEAFKSITEQLMDHLRSNIETEISLMIKQEDLAYFFDLLDHTVKEGSSKTSPAWRPSGDPYKDCRDHLMDLKQTYKDQLKSKLEKIENENKALEDVVLPQRKRVEENQKLLTQKSQHLTEAVESCQKVDISKLQEQAQVLTKQ